MRKTSAVAHLGLLAAAACLLAPHHARGVGRDIVRQIRETYEGRSLRLRIDLRAAGLATAPNVVSVDGVGSASERSAILFGRLEMVYLQKITNEGGARVSLTVYRSEDEANRLRASAVPPPAIANPNFGGTIASFAQQGSTSVLLELKAGKKESQKQKEEIEALLDRVFYLKGDPSREELQAFVRGHTGWPISRLRALTGLPEDEIRAALKSAAAEGGTP